MRAVKVVAALAAFLTYSVQGWAVEVGATCSAHEPAEISSSVFLAGDWDYMDWYNNGNSTCIQMVEKISCNNVKAVQFIPTFYWMDKGAIDAPAGFDPACSGPNARDGYYCYNRFNATEVDYWCYKKNQDEHTCSEVTSAQMSDFSTNFGKCLQRAADLGLDIAINARVDDGRSLGGWRNTINFSPTEQLGSWSYVSAILYPIVDAIRLGANPDTKVEMVLQGEMGATVFMHPEDWAEARRLVESRLVAGAPAGANLAAENVQIGLALNNNKLCGCIGIDIVDGNEYLRFLQTHFAEYASMFDMRALRDVFHAYDFIGVSAYVPMRQPNIEECEFEGLMERMDEEFNHYKITLEQLLGEGKGLHFIEFGVGGGLSSDGVEIATTAEQAAYYPFFGRYGSYGCATDPFQMCSPNLPSTVRDYRRDYYATFSKYLLSGGCKYRVQAVYIWNLASWDVQNIYPISFSNERSAQVNPRGYYDPVVVETINKHNAAALAHCARSQRRATAKPWCKLAAPTAEAAGAALTTPTREATKAVPAATPAREAAEAAIAATPAREAAEAAMAATPAREANAAPAAEPIPAQEAAAAPGLEPESAVLTPAVTQTLPSGLPVAAWALPQQLPRT